MKLITVHCVDWGVPVILEHIWPSVLRHVNVPMGMANPPSITSALLSSSVWDGAMQLHSLSYTMQLNL